MITRRCFGLGAELFLDEFLIAPRANALSADARPRSFHRLT